MLVLSPAVAELFDLLSLFPVKTTFALPYNKVSLIVLRAFADICFKILPEQLLILTMLFAGKILTSSR